MRKQVFKRKPGDLFGLSDKDVLFLLRKSRDLPKEIEEIAKINKVNLLPVLKDKDKDKESDIDRTS